jgi:Family of unknown function (DUF6152)
MPRGRLSRVKLRLLVVLALLAPGAALAHHSPAGRFDTASIKEVEGVITAVHWRSPHVELTLDTVDAAGVRTTWHLEGAAPATLARAGLRTDTIAVGDRVRVAGWPPVTDRQEMFLQNILLPTGKELLLWVSAKPRWSKEQVNDFAFWRQSKGDASHPELGIFRVWSSSLALPNLFGLGANEADNYPLTSAARDAVERFKHDGKNLVAQGCVPKGMPLMMEQPYPLEFARDGKDVVIHMEEYDALRRIHMDRDEPPADAALSPLGYSVGHWEGTTLVVATTRINWPWFNQSGIPQSPNTVLAERFTPSADGSRLTYELTATDPANFTEPVKRGKQWLYLPDQTLRSYDCDPASAE